MVTQVIVCRECGEESEGKARGWRAYLRHDEFAMEEPVTEVAIYCPTCASVEFDISGDR